ncbi:helix-turn-helix transcriptional regulator [Candidatus Woesearchaeota archaeon]|nr:helix-turn-helix transcriptional regulator [Candidatus Woesearchaeota archaeon]
MHSACTVYRTADFVSKRWTLPILLELYKDNAEWKRYSHLKGKLEDITPKILSSRLKELEKEGMIIKMIDAKTYPIKCEYSLAPSGKDFIRIIKDIKKWALKWNIKNKACENSDCSTCTL